MNTTKMRYSIESTQITAKTRHMDTDQDSTAGSRTPTTSRVPRLQAHLGWRNTSNYSDRKTMDFLAETGQYEELNERLSNEFRNDFNHGNTGLTYSYNRQDTFRLQVGMAYEHGFA